MRVDGPAITENGCGAERDVDPGGVESSLFDGKVQEVIAADTIDGEIMLDSGEAVVAVCDAADKILEEKRQRSQGWSV